MIQAEPSPAAPPAAPAAAERVLVRGNHTTVAANLDAPLSLVKAGRREEMIARRILFVNVAVTQVRPAGAPESGGADRYRWTLTSFLEREYCVRSLTGVLACTTPEVAAEGLLSSTLAARSDEIFAADRQAQVDPFLKASGVKLVAGPKAAPRR
jgi:hypothetical protein